MRNLIYSMNVSLDGFVEDVKHNIDWITIDEELHQYFNDQEAEVDTFIYGRRMYEIMSAYWPTADEDPSIPGYMLEYARIWRQKPKIVFSSTLEKVAWNSRLVKKDIVAEVARLKAQPGNTLSVGGAHIAADLVKHNLIDEYQLLVQPIMLGAGTPFFPAGDVSLTLRLMETRRFESGVVLLRYQKGNVLRN